MPRPLILIIILLTLNTLQAQDAPDDREADHSALRQILIDVTHALNTRDADTAATYFADDFVFTPLNQRRLTSRDEIGAFVDEMFVAPTAPLADLQIEPEASIKTIFTSEDTGYCYGTARETYTLQTGGQVVLETHWTATVVRQDGTWKASTVHVGIDPLDNPILTSASTSTGGTMLFLLILGAALGAVGGAYLKGRRPKEPAA